MTYTPTCKATTEGEFETVMCDREPGHDGMHFWHTDGWQPSYQWM